MAQRDSSVRPQHQERHPRFAQQATETGFTYDDNDFETNQYIHPFDGLFA